MTETWPFWAATPDERIEAAFDLADLRAGELLVDLGCGDGGVLLRAALGRSARVIGVELDPTLASAARQLLADHGIDDARIREDDLQDALPGGRDPIASPDVVFAYLSPATLQRLRSRFAQLAAGTRLLTAGWPVPGWQPDAIAGRAYLYTLPATVSDPVADEPLGWGGEGLLVAVKPDTPTIVGVSLVHAGGDVDVAAEGDRRVAVRAGLDTAARGEEVVVDIRVEPLPAGAAARATVSASGAPPFDFVAVAAGVPGRFRLSS